MGRVGGAPEATGRAAGGSARRVDPRDDGLRGAARFRGRASARSRGLRSMKLRWGRRAGSGPLSRAWSSPPTSGGSFSDERPHERPCLDPLTLLLGNAQLRTPRTLGPRAVERARPRSILIVRSLSNPPVSVHNSRNRSRGLLRRKSRVCRHFASPHARIYCLPCRRSWVRIPSAALRMPR